MAQNRHSCLRRKVSSSRRDVTVAQRLGNHSNERSMFGNLAFLQCWVCGDYMLAGFGDLAILLERFDDSRKRPPKRVERRKPWRLTRDCVGDGRAERHLAVEQDFSLVGEMAEERPLGDAGTSGDLSCRRRVEAMFGEQLKCRGHKAFAGDIAITRHPNTLAYCQLMSPTIYVSD